MQPKRPSNHKGVTHFSLDTWGQTNSIFGSQCSSIGSTHSDLQYQRDMDTSSMSGKSTSLPSSKLMWQWIQLYDVQGKVFCKAETCKKYSVENYEKIT